MDSNTPVQPQTNPHSNDPPPVTVPRSTGTQDLLPSAKAIASERSKTFGNIPGVPIFSQWEKRVECCNDSVHRSIFAGVCGNKRYGAYSVAVSGQYRDDEDGGDIIIYTGAGGRKPWTDGSPSKRLRFGPQIEDQSWDHTSNRALMISYHTGKPVRVVRSWKCPSKYAPVAGYRYDGLYIVASCWTAIGAEGFNICRCRLERLPDQPPLPVRPITIPASRRKYTKRIVDRLTSSASRFTGISNQTNANVGLNEPSPPTQEAMGMIARWLDIPQERAMSETSTWFDVPMDVDEPSSLQNQAPHNSDSPPRYECGTKRNVDTAAETEDEHRGEDDATLVPSEDGHADMPLDEHVESGMETEYFSDV